METTDAPAEQSTPTSGSPSRRVWWSVPVAVVLIAAAFAGGFLTGRAGESDRISDRASEATTAACHTWQVEGTGADQLAARVRTALQRSGFMGDPGRKYLPVVTAARKAAATSGLDDEAFAVFTVLALRADAAQRAITPNSVATLDHDTLSAYQEALAAVAVTCHTA